MKHALLILSLCAVVAAQDPNAKRDAKLIAAAKQASAHELDNALPKLSFEKWIEKQSGPDAKYHWEANDCGEQSGNPNDTGPVPFCVEVDSTLKDGREVVVFVADDSPEEPRRAILPAGKSSLHS